MRLFHLFYLKEINRVHNNTSLTNDSESYQTITAKTETEIQHIIKCVI